VKKKNKQIVPREKLMWYFNIKPRTLSNYTKIINFSELYHKFVAANTLREQKDILYGLGPKVNEEYLDFIWINYIYKVERRMIEKENEIKRRNKK
jgi:hypothetical protein